MTHHEPTFAQERRLEALARAADDFRRALLAALRGTEHLTPAVILLERLVDQARTTILSGGVEKRG